MPTIRHLLDRYGQPPQELAFDWAWQIKQHLDRLDQRDQPDTCNDQAHDQTHDQFQDSHTCLLACRPWTELNVTEDGQLECDELECAAARQALEDLQLWAGHALSHQLTQSDDSSASEAGYANVASSFGQKRTAKRGRSNVGSRDLRMLLAKHQQRLSIAAIAILLTGATIYWATSQKAAVVASSAASASAPSVNDGDGSDFNAISQPSANDLANELATDSSAQSFESLTLFEPSQLPTPDASSSSAPTSVAQLSVDAALGTSPASGTMPSSSTETTSEASGSEASGKDGDKGVDGKLATDADNSNSNTKPNAETLVEIKQTLKRVESEESIAVANRHRGVVQDAHGDPWILSRDTMRYRVNLSPQLNVSSRESQWTLALEPIAGLVVEPQRPVTIGPRGLAVWRIYEADAKSPRACLQVRAFHRGRDGELELVFCGGAEDMPGMSVPLGARWLEPLIVRMQSQAIELRNALSQLSTTVILREQVPAVMQRKQAMVSQMFTANRLGVIMPEVNRLAQLVDGQVTMHAALKPKPGEPPVATWGRLP